ncbi:MAG: hypothetical protein PHE09_20960, partial [Oscillospiraceae bacterium]|nr:hypothetical protein [Oscillospiraceae bacterium]
HQQVVVMQGDYTSIQVQANFVDATGTQINISGKTIYFQCYKNGKSITLDTPAVSGDGLSAIAAILPSACATSGELSGEFQIVDEEGGKKVPPFKIMVLSSPDDAMQTTDFKVLTEKLGDVNSAVADVNKAVTDANTAITNINAVEQSITTAESSRTTAEGGRVTAENGRVVTEQDRVIAENDRVTAENNRKTAETQRQTDTTTAITNAEAATNNANHVPQYGDNGNWESWNGTAYADSGKPWKGEKGDTGPSFEYGESYDTLAALQAAYPSGDTKGHLVGTIPYVWDGTAWKESVPDLSDYLKSNDADEKYAKNNGISLSGSPVTASGVLRDCVSSCVVHGKTTQTVTQQGKNLFDKDKAIENYYINADGGNIAASSVSSTSDYIFVVPSTAYTLTYTPNIHAKAIVFFDNTKTFISGILQNVTSSNTFTTPANTAFIRFSYANTAITVQLELGSTATTYEPFVPNSPSPDYPAPIHGAGGAVTTNGGSLAELPQEMFDDDWWDAVSGLGQAENVKLILDGTESWAQGSSTDSNVFFMHPSITLLSGHSICDHYPYGASTADINHFDTQYGEIRFRVGDTYTLDAWKSYLAAQKTANTPVVVVYKSATPTPITGAPTQLLNPSGELTVSQADGAQLDVTVSGAASAAGLDALDANKAEKSTLTTATISASGWTGTKVPYSYTLSIAGITATSNQEFLPALDITADQLTALQSANIVDGGQSDGNVTLEAFGTKPTIDIPLRVIVRGDA